VSQLVTDEDNDQGWPPHSGNHQNILPGTAVLNHRKHNLNDQVKPKGPVDDKVGSTATCPNATVAALWIHSYSRFVVADARMIERVDAEWYLCLQLFVLCKAFVVVET
jgi:hypothetical protein